MARRKRFNSEKSALSFAKKVDGKVNDCRNIEGAKSPFTVTYQPNEKTRKHGQGRFYEPENDKQRKNLIKCIEFIIT